MTEISDNLMVQASVKLEDQRREIATLRAENERLREELACTIEELIDHTGDDMIDSRQARVNSLRSVTGSTDRTKQSPLLEALHDLLTRPTDPAARERARAALSEAQP